MFAIIKYSEFLSKKELQPRYTFIGIHTDAPMFFNSCSALS